MPTTSTPADGRADAAKKPKEVIKQGLSEYFLFTIEGREDISDKEPKRLVSMKVGEVPLECFYKLTDRDGGTFFTKFYRFKNLKLMDEKGQEKKLPSMENLGLSPLPDGNVRLFSEYQNKDLAYVGGTATKYVPIGDRVEVNVGRDQDITIARRLKDQKITNVVARQYKKRLDNTYVQYYDLMDYDETFYYEEEIVSGKPAKTELERRFDANVVLLVAIADGGFVGAERSTQGLELRRGRGLRRSARRCRQGREGRSEPRQVLSRSEARRKAVREVLASPISAARWGRN